MMQNGIDRENLQKLATYLAYGELPKDVRFDMTNFTNGSQLAPTCGTAGCAVGFAPFAGIEKKRDETFREYSYRTLIDRKINHRAWDWCFAAEWSRSDTPLGAAKRIQKFLNDGMWLLPVLLRYEDVEVLR